MKKIVFGVVGPLMMGLAQAATVNLSAPDILGVSCGGYQAGSSLTIVGFDTNGNVQGMLNEVMACSTGGRGSHPAIFKGSSKITWDFRGGYITSWNAPLAISAVGNTATDHYGNVVMAGNPNLLNAVLTMNQMPPNPVYVEALVPNLVGDTDLAAKAAIAAAGLGNVNLYVSYYAAPAGLVFSQSPAAGSMMPFGSGVSIWETPTASSGGGGDGSNN
jgi:hypothetical protein